MILEPEIGDLIRWSRVDFHKHYLAGYAVVTKAFGLMIQIHWLGKSPVPLETTEKGFCWVYRRRCIIISRHGDPFYENLRYDRRQVVELRKDGEERRKGKT